MQGQFRLLLSPSKQADGATFPGLPMPGSGSRGHRHDASADLVRVVMGAKLGWEGRNPFNRPVAKTSTARDEASFSDGRDAVLGTVVRTSIVMKHRIPHQRGWPGVAVLYMGVCVLR